MSRVVFKTGKRHQEATARWARRRLADGGGRRFSVSDDQDGILFADSVGLGKTWEALAAAALILYKASPKAGLRHVLILCPPNLVTKWEEELSARSPFRDRLDRWARGLTTRGQAAPARRVLETLTQTFAIRSSKHVQMRKKYGKFHPPGGTYIVSQSLVTRPGAGLNALRREEWDIIIVDEAHNAAAHKALEQLQKRRRARTKLLLTATPFQLEPRQWNKLARNLLKRGDKVLSRAEIAGYIAQLAEVFENPQKPGPKPKAVREASETLKKLAARTVPRASNREYELLVTDGRALPMPARLDELDDSAVAALLAKLREQTEESRSAAFDVSYFENRLRISLEKRATYVATKLRRLLAAGTEEQESPRRVALTAWAKANLAKDIGRALKTGMPHKLIVFTAWVGGAQGEAAILKARMTNAFADALKETRQKHEHRWDVWLKTGARRLELRAKSASSDDVANALRTLATDELTAALAGKHRRFVKQLAMSLERHAKAIEEVREELRSLADRRGFEARALRRRLSDIRQTLSPWGGGGEPLGSVERYTGNERRSERDRAATAFRQMGPPWVLVASNVGSEGIDLHTYTARIVHYDLEWNPAKMEQREGRGDRVGRRLKDRLSILYCLVPRTYDERMFHQLVARDRWHGILLGRPACRLLDDATDAPVMAQQRLRKMRLDLAPE